MCDLVGNPEDRFSHNEAHIVLTLKSHMVSNLSPSFASSPYSPFKFFAFVIHLSELFFLFVVYMSHNMCKNLPM